MLRKVPTDFYTEIVLACLEGEALQEKDLPLFIFFKLLGGGNKVMHPKSVSGLCKITVN